MSYAVPVYQGCALDYSSRKLNFGGKNISDYIGERLSGSFGNMNIIRKEGAIEDIKKLCNFDPEPGVPYTLPGKLLLS